MAATKETGQNPDLENQSAGVFPEVMVDLVIESSVANTIASVELGTVGGMSD
jgi:hypothetical protein